MSSPQRQLHLNLFINGAGHHQAAWRHRDSQPEALFDLDYYIKLAQKAEAAKLDSLYFSDRLAIRNQQSTSVIGALEPFTLLSALAVQTEKIGLIATASTTYNQPYHVARKLAALDHISEGRAGWNLVTSHSPEESRNFGLSEVRSENENQQRAIEFFEVAKKLFDSWDDDARVYDKEKGIMADISKVRAINHQGEHFSIDGPLNAPRPIQGYPVLVQSGITEKGRDFAALVAEVVLTIQNNLDEARSFYADLKARAASIGREREDLKILSGLSFILGETPSQAEDKAAELDELLTPSDGLSNLSRLLKIDLSEYPLDSPLPPLSSPDSIQTDRGRIRLISNLANQENLTVRQLIRRLAAGRAHNHFVGTPLELADHIEEWFSSYAADGFNLRPALLPTDFEIFADKVVPELQRRGLFRSEYTGDTLREHFELGRPVNPYTAIHESQELESLAGQKL